MQAREIQHSTLLDIIFENRNKAYGAYVLRKQYHYRLTIGLLISVTISVIISFTLKSGSLKEMPGFIFTPVELISIHPDELILPAPALLKQAMELPSREQIRDVVPIIVPNQPLTDIVPTNDEKEIAFSGHENIKGSTDGINTAILITTNHGNTGIDARPVETAVTEIYERDKVEEPAEFPGGKEGLERFLRKNLVSPPVDENIRIQIRVKFVIGKDGRVEDARILKDGGEIYNEEVLRVVKKMPRWKPARQHGIDVPMYFVLPVTFVSETE